MKHAVLIDFGSTYTKMLLVDLEERSVIISTKVPSTVHEDAEIGLNQCFDAARNAIGEKKLQAALKLATSSAAGGLRMAVVGLTKTLSNEAGRNASFSAGAKIVYNTSGILSERDLADIEKAKAEILLLCGGYERGNTKGVLANASILAESALTIPVIYAGNSFAAWDVRRRFSSFGKECFLAENIIPDVGCLNTEPTAEIVRELFMSRITNMKGVGVVQGKMAEPIVPTPLAVLRAGELLSKGTESEAGLGPVMMADIGGATTDIYSYLDNKCYSGARCIGTPEPFAKRTVEGDMGMRESSINLLREFGRDQFCAKCGETADFIEAAIEKRITQTKYLADSEREQALDHNIACCALAVSARRHAGYIEKGYSDGLRLIQHGKNLTEIRTVVGTGGIIVNEQNPEDILQQVFVKGPEAGKILLPEKADVLIDRDYVLFAAGLLRKYDETAALAIMKKSLGVM